MSKIGSIIGSSFMSILPGASAASVAYEVDAIEKYTKENCPELAEIGGLAGNFCEAYIISDMDTINEDPAKFISDLYLHGDFVDDSGEDNEMPRIAKDSGLAKYIIYCGQRESGFGTADFNIANSIETLGSSADPSAGSNADDNNSAFSQAAGIVTDAAVGSVPLVGDGLDIWGSDKIRRNIGYVSGRVCVTKHLDEGEDGDLTEDWEYNGKYQRFVQDSLAAETEGDIEKSPVTAFLEDYYKEHPLDNSSTGILARYSGQSKENVELALDFIELSNFVASYEPSELSPAPQKSQEIKKLVIDSPNTVNDSYVATLIIPARNERRISSSIA